MTSRILIGSSAAILLYLGSVHLAYTLLTHKFNPTERQPESAMKHVAPRISNEMTMWKAWLGFNVSHSMGLLLFGLIYGYMVVYRWEVLRTSYFLAGTGLLMLVGYVVLPASSGSRHLSLGSRGRRCSTFSDLLMRLPGLKATNNLQPLFLHLGFNQRRTAKLNREIEMI